MVSIAHKIKVTFRTNCSNSSDKFQNFTDIMFIDLHLDVSESLCYFYSIFQILCKYFCILLTIMSLDIGSFVRNNESLTKIDSIILTHSCCLSFSLKTYGHM